MNFDCHVQPHQHTTEPVTLFARVLLPSPPQYITPKMFYYFHSLQNRLWSSEYITYAKKKVNKQLFIEEREKSFYLSVVWYELQRILVKKLSYSAAGCQTKEVLLVLSSTCSQGNMSPYSSSSLCALKGNRSSHSLLNFPVLKGRRSFRSPLTKFKESEGALFTMYTNAVQSIGVYDGAFSFICLVFPRWN